MNRIISLFIFLVLIPSLLLGEDSLNSGTQKKITISGHVRDQANGEVLSGVTIIENNLKQGTSTNAYRILLADHHLREL